MSKELIERLEKAEAGSRELDAAVWEALTGETPSFPFGEPDSDGPWIAYGNGIWETARPLTTFLDAALALAERVLPGWNWCVGRDAGAADFARYRAWVQSEEDRQANPLGLSSEAAPTAPLALCIAILKAQGAQQ